MIKFKIEYYYEYEYEDCELEDILHEVIVYDESWEKAVEKFKSKKSKDCVVGKISFENYESGVFSPVSKRKRRTKIINQ